MEGNERREQILNILLKQGMPVSGIKLATEFKVSRQVIVQDVAILRAKGYDILATARGYILNEEKDKLYSRVFLVTHTEEMLEDELNIMVDNGGRVRDVIINHPLYGELIGNLMLKNRRDVQSFILRVKAEKAYPLLKLTEGIHMHTVEASNMEELDCIEEELGKKGYLYLA